MTLRRATLTIGLIAAAVGLPQAIYGQDDQLKIGWEYGPTTSYVGKELATVDVPEGYAFTQGDDTRKLMEMIGNPPTHEEVGLITPMDHPMDWFIVFEFSDVGYIRDDDRHALDSDAILESYRRGTEASNDKRREMGAPALHVKGWWEEPRYDPKTNNLTWGLLAESDGEEVVNYNVRFLGREGYTSATLVGDPETLFVVKPDFESILATFGYVPGKRYAEYVPGDRSADYGLTTLVAGAAGAAAVKTGLFAALFKMIGKAWKLVVGGVIAGMYGLRGVFTGGSVRESA